jgi:GT2 family glycosyltransferase
MNTELTISIVNYNSGEYLPALLRSIYSGGITAPFEVILVDNASSDGSLEYVAGSFPQVKIIKNTSNLGFAKAQNMGIKSSSGKFFLMLNPDMTVMPGAINKLLNFMKDHPLAGVVGGKVLNPDGTIQFSGKKFPTPLTAVFLSLGLHRLWPGNPISREYYMEEKEYDRTKEVDHVMGSFLMARKEVFVKTGPLDELFFLYCEDVDWCMRAKNTGFKIYYFPEAAVTHQKGGASRKESYKATVEHHKSLRYFYKKWYGNKYPAVVNFFFHLGITARKWVYLLINFFSKEKKVRY